jgi:hypothetical protein
VIIIIKKHFSLNDHHDLGYIFEKFLKKHLMVASWWPDVRIKWLKHLLGDGEPEANG